MDETLSHLLQHHQIRNTIVVAIWNNGAYRHAEYFPQKALQGLAPAIKDSVVINSLMNQPQADNYLLFLTKELKPFIDSAYSTHKDKANTFIAGSSMGGLISLYAICEYPNTFGGAACMSTHWLGILSPKYEAIPTAIIAYAKAHLPSPKDHKLYFDYGSATLDRFYKPYQKRMDKVMKEKGYTQTNWITKEFSGDDHSEKSWSRRLYIPMQFLVSNNERQKK